MIGKSRSVQTRGYRSIKRILHYERFDAPLETPLDPSCEGPSRSHIGFPHFLDLVCKLEELEDAANVRGKAVDVTDQVFVDIVWVAF